MKPEPTEIERDDFAQDDFSQVWQAAQLQRSEEFSGWLKQLFRRRRQADRPVPVASPTGRILAAG
jgi:hypothetical protein